MSEDKTSKAGNAVVFGEVDDDDLAWAESEYIPEDKTSPRPWRYHVARVGFDGRVPGWITDANGHTVVSATGSYDGPLIVAAVNAHESSGWRPIETAPKDRNVLIADENYVSLGRLFEDRAVNPPLQYWMRFDGVSEAYAKAYQPTHWLPCPPGPGDTGRATNTGENSAPTQPRIED